MRQKNNICEFQIVSAFLAIICLGFFVSTVAGQARKDIKKPNVSTTTKRPPKKPGKKPVPLKRPHTAVARPSIYRIRITVLNPQALPVDDAKIWSSIGGEAKKVSGGWQFDIPGGSVPKDGKVTFYASRESAFLKGSSDFVLNTDANPTVNIKLARDTSATVRGIVVDPTNQAIKEAKVSVVGYEEEAVTTNSNGGFVLPSHSANGQQVRLHAEKKCYEAIFQYHPAGDESVTLILKELLPCQK